MKLLKKKKKRYEVARTQLDLTVFPSNFISFLIKLLWGLTDLHSMFSDLQHYAISNGSQQCEPIKKQCNLIGLYVWLLLL